MELIALIKNKGRHPTTLNEEVWDRLKKLAKSKQRENRLEHGWYANSCQKMVGRIGSLGVEGIREKLRELYRRSPDPDDV